jgi:hypothetical protein
MNLSLYAVNAFIVLDTDGHRVLAKYYSPKGRTQLGQPDANKGLQNLKEQRAFEKGLFAKTKKPGGALLNTWTSIGSPADTVGPFMLFISSFRGHR